MLPLISVKLPKTMPLINDISMSCHDYLDLVKSCNKDFLLSPCIFDVWVSSWPWYKCFALAEGSFRWGRPPTLTKRSELFDKVSSLSLSKGMIEFLRVKLRRPSYQKYIARRNTKIDGTNFQFSNILTTTEILGVFCTTYILHPLSTAVRK